MPRGTRQQPVPSPEEMKRFSPAMIGSEALMSYLVFQGNSQTFLPSAALTIMTLCFTNSRTCGLPSRWRGMGVAYPPYPGPLDHASLPVFLLKAVPAEPALRINRSPTTSGEAAKPHWGFLLLIGVVHLTSPLSALKQRTIPCLETAYTFSPSIVGVDPGPPTWSLGSFGTNSLAS